MTQVLEPREIPFGFAQARLYARWWVRERSRWRWWGLFRFTIHFLNCAQDDSIALVVESQAAWGGSLISSRERDLVLRGWCWQAKGPSTALGCASLS